MLCELVADIIPKVRSLVYIHVHDMYPEIVIPSGAQTFAVLVDSKYTCMYFNIYSISGVGDVCILILPFTGKLRWYQMHRWN